MNTEGVLMAEDLAEKLPAPGTAFFVFDLSTWVAKAFHARAEQAARIFGGQLGRILDEQEPVAVVLAGDVPGATFRHGLWAGYKEARRKKHEKEATERAALLEQMRQAEEIAEDDYGIRTIKAAGFEADDVIASLVAKATEEDLDVVICGSDKDLLQLVGPHGIGRTTVAWDGKQVMGPEGVMRKLGVSPGKVVDYLACVGDSSDGVPGVWGCGPVAAVAVLGRFPDLRSAIASALRCTGDGGEFAPHKVPAAEGEWWAANRKVWARLASQKSLNAATLCRELVELRRDVPGMPRTIRELAWVR